MRPIGQVSINLWSFLLGMILSAWVLTSVAGIMSERNDRLIITWHTLLDGVGFVFVKKESCCFAQLIFCYIFCSFCCCFLICSWPSYTLHAHAVVVQTSRSCSPSIFCNRRVQLVGNLVSLTLSLVEVDTELWFGLRIVVV